MNGIARLDWSDVPGLRALLDAVDPDGLDLIRLVGGCVRDRLLGLPVSDFDLATVLSPDMVMDRLRAQHIKAIPTGLAHGTVTAVIGAQSFEITTLRRDEDTNGRHARVAFTDDWAEDAKRRDFTINALYSAPLTGEVFDYVDGLQDLSPPYIRFIGDADQRIKEDFLRILRYFRFFARFGNGVPDVRAMAACAANARGLMTLSRERVAQELLKMLGTPNPAPALAAMESLALFASFLPEYIGGGASKIAELVAQEQRLSIPPAAPRRLSAILPRDDGTLRAVSARLKLSNAAMKYLTKLNEARRSWSANASDESHLYRFGVAEGLDSLLLESDSPISSARWDHLSQWQRPVMSVTGLDIIAMGVPRGPMISQALKAVEAAWVDAGFPQLTAFETLKNQVVTQFIDTENDPATT